MASMRGCKGSFSVTAYAGDAKTLLAFNLDKAGANNLGGFTIKCSPDDQPTYYLYNELQFPVPANHTQDPNEPPNSSINAPIQKFRWIHVPGSVHQGLKPFFGKYTYTVTPRYFGANKSLLPLNPSLSVSVDIDVVPFVKGNLRLGFTRGFTQSQAFVHHFGKNALIRPKTDELLFNTSQQSGTNAQGHSFTFVDEYEWLGYTARECIFDLLNEVIQNTSLHLDMFAYDLNEPDLMNIVLEIAKQGRVRIILDNALLHHNAQGTKAEDQFENEFRKVMNGSAAILRGKFGRYAHNKVLIVSNAQGPFKVLTGSTNFSVTGIYVNSNHVLVFDTDEIAKAYSKAFDESWDDNLSVIDFRNSTLATGKFTSSGASIPPITITFSPHSATDRAKVLDGVVKRISAEGTKTRGSVLFAVMEIDNGTSPVYQILNDIHQNTSIFSFGISDGPKGIYLYKRGTKNGLLVSGKPAATVLPPPFDQVPGVGLGHQVHHKFVVCGFNQPDAVVYCGSSNLAVGGEEKNGDNLLEIRDIDVATVFTIEALSLIDHFNFLDKCATGGKGSSSQQVSANLKGTPASPKLAAVSAGWFLFTNDKWTEPYFNCNDLKFADRILFG
ncbi:MAG TPA: phospholipase D-like domain-containing protein [Anaerolineaceae bacterium]|nr:phospholipase D-like domain-containing protein [Anaerolineaceae bacterium]